MNAKMTRQLAAVAALAALPATATAQAACDDTYIVPAAQSVASVAERCEVSLWALIQLNPGLNSADRLRPGQELRIPAVRGVDSEVDAADDGVARRDTDATHIVHVVEGGQTLAEVAVRYGVTVAALLRANDVGDPNVLSVGQRLVIPSRPSVSPASGDPRRDPDAPAPAEARPTIQSKPTAQPVDAAAEPLPAPAVSTARPVAQPAAADPVVTPVAAEPGAAGRPVPVTTEPAVGEPAAPAPDAAPPAQKRVRAVTGTLVGEGGTCPTVRTDDGQVYLLADAIPFLVGTRVTVVGATAEGSPCGPGITLDVEDVEPAPAGADPAPDLQEPDRVYVVAGAYFDGTECPALRTDGGEVYTLTGLDLGDVKEGERISVVGTRARVSVCGQGTTLVVDQLRKPEP